MIADELMRQSPGLQVQVRVYKTTGDQITDRPLHEFGGKGLFTKELEQALLNNEVDFAVHSLKDVPVTMPLVPQQNLILASIPPREDPRDALVSLTATRLNDLPEKAKVGTSSFRRRCQLLAARPDLRIENLRGNLDTRLRKMRDGMYDAIILAMAGLRRSGKFPDPEACPIPLDQMLPAAGQGALALQCRRDDHQTRNALHLLHDPTTATCVEAERAVVSGLNGNCHSPIAALAIIEAKQFTLKAAVGAAGGNPPIITATATVPLTHAQSAAQEIIAQLIRKGASRLLGV